MSRENFGVNDGHTISGAGSGAVGRINESKETRKVGAEVRRLFKAEGQGVVDCTIDYSNSTNENLQMIINLANRQDLDWFISIHFNAGGGKGVEVYTYEGRQYQDAVDVCKNISALGFKNRGVKAGTGLYVIRKTKAKSMLIEVCFVDTDDANKYLEVGYKAIAKAIVEGVLNRKISGSSSSTAPQKPPVNNSQKPLWELCISGQLVRDLQTELNKQCNAKLKVDGYFGDSTLNKCIIVKRGARGNITKVIQKRLQQLNYNIGKYGADGDFSGGTHDAVVRFQKAKKLSVDGIVGKNTWKALMLK